jgi:hypothetical protein
MLVSRISLEQAMQLVRTAFIAIFLLGNVGWSDEPADFVPTPGRFPPAGMGVYLAGELVAIDPINRRGALRLDGDFMEDRYHSAPSHRFALLPYATVLYHGAPAELRDIPLGTHLHGWFVLPPAGDTTIPPPEKSQAKYVPSQNHVLHLADDFSHFSQRGQLWKVTSLEPPQGPRSGKIQVTSTGQLPANLPDKLHGDRTFTLDASTRVWQGTNCLTFAALSVGQEIQLNLAWSPDWVNHGFHAAEIWCDDEARRAATERQRQRHLRHQHHRWLPGWVDHVEHAADGSGVVTITLFGGMDPSLYDEIRRARGQNLGVAASEPTLRTWWQDHDQKYGPLLDYTDTPQPPPGSSGLTLRVRMREVLEGYRPTRVVRLHPDGWPSVKMPPEERIRSIEER